MKSIISVFFILVISGCAPLGTPLTTDIKPTDHPRDVQLKGLMISVADSSLTDESSEFRISFDSKGEAIKYDIKTKKNEKIIGPRIMNLSVRHYLRVFNVLPEWKSGIVNALNKANIFSNSSTRIIFINATLLNFVMQTKAECLFQANYQLIDYNTDELLVEFDIESTGTLKNPWSEFNINWTDYAIKHALSSNIEKLIDKLNELDDKILPIKR